MFKFFDLKGMGCFSWEKIWKYLPVDIIISLLLAIWLQITRSE
jgi:hypothetical protein